MYLLVLNARSLRYIINIDLGFYPTFNMVLMLLCSMARLHDEAGGMWFRSSKFLGPVEWSSPSMSSNMEITFDVSRRPRLFKLWDCLWATMNLGVLIEHGNNLLSDLFTQHFRYFFTFDRMLEFQRLMSRVFSKMRNENALSLQSRVQSRQMGKEAGTSQESRAEPLVDLIPFYSLLTSGSSLKVKIWGSLLLLNCKYRCKDCQAEFQFHATNWICRTAFSTPKCPFRNDGSQHWPSSQLDLSSGLLSPRRRLWHGISRLDMMHKSNKFRREREMSKRCNKRRVLPSP